MQHSLKVEDAESKGRPLEEETSSEITECENIGNMAPAPAHSDVGVYNASHSDAQRSALSAHEHQSMHHFDTVGCHLLWRLGKDCAGNGREAMGYPESLHHDMRFSALFIIAPFFALSLAAPAAPTDADIIDCMPATVPLKRRLVDSDYDFESRGVGDEFQLEARAPSGQAAAATAKQFIKYLADNSAKLTKAPVFWTGKTERRGAKAVADRLKKDPAVVGKIGGQTVFDVIAEAGVSPVGWKPDTDWRAVCGAFAKHSQPASKKAFLVYGALVDQQANIWTSDEWPALKANSKIAEVVAHKMKADGKTWEAGSEIKKSGKGSPF
ncbi:hypothetical protein Hypma_000919 [Hypsizygus marmoreus]|uniref:Uncharacterized protein n=1 Tax=Hypsizygus marmoreus TaxID=39966 RepID=A0A369J9R3_HYPMA|nr:hypothetical protein Hypma_000919 [Hypsizygus marmoreus]